VVVLEGVAVSYERSTLVAQKAEVVRPELPPTVTRMSILGTAYGQFPPPSLPIIRRPLGHGCEMKWEGVTRRCSASEAHV
jgi:hypothetical protein